MCGIDSGLVAISEDKIWKYTLPEVWINLTVYSALPQHVWTLDVHHCATEGLQIPEAQILHYCMPDSIAVVLPQVLSGVVEGWRVLYLANQTVDSITEGTEYQKAGKQSRDDNLKQLSIQPHTGIFSQV